MALYTAPGRWRGNKLAPYFVTALEISAKAHKDMVAAVAPFIDTSISKTVNVPRYPYAEFENLYLDAWSPASRASPPTVPTACWAPVLSVTPSSEQKQPQDVGCPTTPTVVCPSRTCRPRCSSSCAGRAARICRMATPPGPSCSNTRRQPPCSWVTWTRSNPARAPSRSKCGWWCRPARGLGAVAKTLSMDMRANDRGWLKLKLDALAKTVGEKPFELRFPPTANRTDAGRRLRLRPGRALPLRS